MLSALRKDRPGAGSPGPWSTWGLMTGHDLQFSGSRHPSKSSPMATPCKILHRVIKGMIYEPLEWGLRVFTESQGKHIPAPTGQGGVSDKVHVPSSKVSDKDPREMHANTLEACRLDDAGIAKLFGLISTHFYSKCVLME